MGQVIKIALLFCAMGLLSAGTSVQTNPDTNSKMKAIFIYNFARYIEWPKEYKQGNFVIGLLGDSPLYNELSNMSKTKKVATQSIQVQKYNSDSDIGKCHVLYIPKMNESKLSNALSKLDSAPTLIVTESSDLVNNIPGINFVIINQRQKFELNKTKVENRKLKVSVTLEKLASKVY
ncbi:MAG: YfiR family protein [Salibacteraceae bacterium]